VELELPFVLLRSLRAIRMIHQLRSLTDPHPITTSSASPCLRDVFGVQSGLHLRPFFTMTAESPGFCKNPVRMSMPRPKQRWPIANSFVSLDSPSEGLQRHGQTIEPNGDFGAQPNLATSVFVKTLTCLGNPLGQD